MIIRHELSFLGPKNSSHDIPNGKWVAQVSCRTDLESDPRDRRETEDPETGHMTGLLVPKNRVNRNYWRIVGVDKIDVEVRQLVDGRSRTNRSWYNAKEFLVIADQPFALIYARYDGRRSWYWRDGKDTVRVARQVHKGELGRTYAPQQHLKSELFQVDLYVDSDGTEGMVYEYFTRLRDLAGVIEKDSRNVLCRSALIASAGDESTFIEVHNGKDFFRVYTQGKLPKGLRELQITYGCKNISIAKFEQLNLHRGAMWIKTSLACNMQILVAMGFYPGEQLGKSFRLQAEKPEPFNPPGLLPEVPIDVARELRANRSDELSKHDFMNKLHDVLGGDGWRDAPHLNEEAKLRGFHTNYRVKTLFGGQLTVGFCNWVNPGGKHDIKWAGFITVTETATMNPRRDPALYRLRIWPSGIFRETPSGAIGGFFPEIAGVTPQIMQTIKQIVEPLGFVERSDS